MENETKNEKRTHYKSWNETIKIYCDKKDNTIKASGSWANRDEECKQKVIPFSKQDRENNLGFVLSDMLVLDLDVGHDDGANGIVTFTRWAKAQGNEMYQQIIKDIQQTLIVNTPKKGVHIHFKINGKNEGHSKSKIDDGVDIITGSRQFVPAPNTRRNDGWYKINPNGSEYIAEVPAWLNEWIEKGDIYKKKKEYLTKEERFFGRKSAIDTKNYEVQTLVNEVITTMFNGFEQGERNTGMTKHIGKILNLVKRKQITLNNGALIAKQTALYCKPEMSEKEVAQIWNSLMKREVKSD